MGATGRGNRMFGDGVRLIKRTRWTGRDRYEVEGWNMMFQRFAPWSAKSLGSDI